MNQKLSNILWKCTVCQKNNQKSNMQKGRNRSGRRRDKHAYVMGLKTSDYRKGRRAISTEQRNSIIFIATFFSTLDIFGIFFSLLCGFCCTWKQESAHYLQTVSVNKTLLTSYFCILLPKHPKGALKVTKRAC